MKKYISIAILFSGLMSLSAYYGCTDKTNQSVIQINYGTSFGECVGYCKHDMSVKSDQITYTCSGWNNEVSTFSHYENINSELWDSLRTDFNLNKFFDLPTTIGCPDCADGGAEWVEIKLSNGQSHKVVFEYNNSPETVSKLINKLNTRLNANNCNQ